MPKSGTAGRPNRRLCSTRMNDDAPPKEPPPMSPIKAAIYSAGLPLALLVLNCPPEDSAGGEGGCSLPC